MNILRGMTPITILNFATLKCMSTHSTKQENRSFGVERIHVEGQPPFRRFPCLTVAPCSIKKKAQAYHLPARYYSVLVDDNTV